MTLERTGTTLEWVWNGSGMHWNALEWVWNGLK